ncbi:hypothetical protein TNCV_1860801 [Trichonephila clavipes]|nr:hypothetical protein TNCV_1860801 [Trichonephila clavipes]
MPRNVLSVLGACQLLDTKRETTDAMLRKGRETRRTTPGASDDQWLLAEGSLVVRASNSRPEGLGSMPYATKYPLSTHGVCDRC